ncbi:oxygen-independent coproporphyrinogen III oxidase [Exilibacterium tricleocarpae]|uniref:Coproporphyrinogen-III oxidase n=1 Tax=Exilibacterium tricleocarpae TaxID=2591008 RepID=A0A545U857_9GAMM|nr:oxygen-independent coproporphyrinogen III oxidase [Exilibacterium tricleocarpae]TQV85639.1 oxygen-independent coproporphyrinogen III oxidase [Exilibacterium tricleocarpae]
MNCQPIRWNTELIRRYDLAGPRYTSYPTAPQFRENFTSAELTAAIDRSNASQRPLSLYVHIPFCDTVCYYCACNKIVTANKNRARPYLDNLYEEMRMLAPLVDAQRQVNQLHLGGGTPTFISDGEMAELMANLRSLFALRDDDSGEYSIEVHPGRMNVSTVAHLRSLGFNRLSMGIQDFDADVQQAVNRFNSVDQVTALVEAARHEGFHSLSMDLIYGLPRQNLASFDKTLAQVIELAPDRLSLFNYAHMPHLFKTQRQIDAATLPAPALKLRMLEFAIDRLTRAGYRYIGMDHFAKPDDPLALAQARGELQRNFQGYATHGDCDLFAFGVSAISAIDNVFVQNHKQIDDYTRALNGKQLPLARGLALSADDRLRQAVIRELTCQFALDIRALEQRFAIRFDDYFAAELEALQPLAKDKLVTLTPEQIQVTAEGRLLIRRICMVFDAYLKVEAQQVKYSRII